jgi:hypothetical protein
LESRDTVLKAIKRSIMARAEALGVELMLALYR